MVHALLTEIGINQAKVASKYFINHNITLDHAYSSTSEIVSNGKKT